MAAGSAGLRSLVFAAGFGVLLYAAPIAESRRPQQAPAAVHAVTWPDQRETIEAWLREAPIEKMEDIPIGVTRPKRAFFPPAGPIRSAAWKPLLPGRYKGFWESYKAEIAAYELDKLLGLNMVPPAVERSIRGARGAIVMWVDGVKGWSQDTALSPPDPTEWSRQVIRMKMFDQLIGNIDRNQGNLLYDADFHLILIDHSRAFTSMTDIKKLSAPTRIDGWLWDRTLALTMEDLEARLGKWIGGREMEAILQRRDRMKLQVEELVRTSGEALAIIR